MIKFSAKYLDGIWRSYNYTMYSKDTEIEYAKELVEMFRHLLHKGNILGYTVELIIGEKTDIIESEEI